jgi:glycosyltransferase involved in cell wall biosynthesis
MIFLSTYPLETHVMASVRLRKLLRFMAEKKRSCTCICPEEGDGKWSYVLRAARLVSEAVRKNPQEIVIASVPGIQALAAAVLARWSSRVPFRLVLEVRDPFSLNPALPWSTLKRAVGYQLERVLLRAPDRAIFLTPVIQSMYVNGFPGCQRWKSAISKPLTLTYVGQFYDRRHPIDFLTALRDYLHSHPDTSLPRVQIAGQIFGAALQRQVKSVCEDSRLQHCVKWLGTIPHEQTLGLMQTSDINLLITHDRGSEYAIPGKIFEYMAAQRPVLVLSQDPLVKQLMQETRLGWICEDRSALTRWFSEHLDNTQSLQDWEPNHKAMAVYKLENIHPKWLDFVEGEG